MTKSLGILLAVLLLLAAFAVPVSAGKPVPARGYLVPNPPNGTIYGTVGGAGSVYTSQPELHPGRANRIEVTDGVVLYPTEGDVVACQFTLNITALSEEGQSGVGHWNVQQSDCGLHGSGKWYFDPSRDEVPVYVGRIHLDGRHGRSAYSQNLGPQAAAGKARGSNRGLRGPIRP